MLMSYENTVPMQQFANEVLDPVIQYEKKAHTQLIETMWAYFECDCNLQRTADKLFSHKKHCKIQITESRAAYRKKFYKQISESGAIQCTHDILFFLSEFSRKNMHTFFCFRCP